MPVFLQHHLEESWVRAGVGDTTRHVPLHVLYGRLPPTLCAVLPDVHSLTGCDTTSRVGTKKATLKAEPEKFLKQFGTSPTLPEPVVQDAENYLVKVLKSRNEANNFAELWAEVFHQAKTSSHQNLLPTCFGILPHIEHALYNTYAVMHALYVYLAPEDPPPLKPDNWGYIHDHSLLVPASSWKSLTSHWTVVCSCTKCARSSCQCKPANVKCVNFFH